MKLGIIGAGRMAEVYHLPYFSELPGVTITAICDTDSARAERASHRVGARAFTDYQALLQSGLVDAVCICTRNDTHAEIAVAAARAGLHTLLEKPMATTLADAQRICAAVEESGVVFLLGLLNRFRTEAQLIHTRQVDGRLGEIYHAEARWLRRRGAPRGWFTQREISGGGPLLDIGVHALDLAWYLMGRPKPLRACGVTHSFLGLPGAQGVAGWGSAVPAAPPNVEDSAVALVRFAGGASLQLAVSWALNTAGLSTSGDEIACIVHGTQAGAQLSPLCFFGEADGYLVDEAPRFEKRDPWREAFARQAAHFAACVRGQQSPNCTAADGVVVQSIIDGIYRSAQKGQEVAL